MFTATITLHVICYLQMVDDTKAKISVGVSMITFICLMLAFNLVPILIDLAKCIRLCVIKIYRKIIKRITKWTINH